MIAAENKKSSGRKESRLIAAITVFVLLGFAALFLARHADDNALTSWRWVFDRVAAWKAYLAICVGMGLAWQASRLRLPGPGLLFAAAFAVSAIFWRVPEVIVDASRYFTQAKHLELYGIGYFVRNWGGPIGAWTDLPAVPFIYGLLFKFLGESRLVVQAFNSTVFSLCVALVFLVGRDLRDEETGSLAGLMMLSVPYLYTQVPLMLVDVSSMFFLLLSYYMFGRALSMGGITACAVSSLSLFMTLLSKYSLWPMLSVLAVIFIARMTEPGVSRRRLVLRGLSVLLTAAALAGAFWIYKLEVISGQIRLLLEYQRPGLGRWTESFASTFLFQTSPLLTAAAIYSLYAAARKRDLRYAAVAWLVLLAVVAGVRRIRYLLPLFPMVSIMAAYGLRGLDWGRARRFAALGAASSSVAIVLFAYVPFLDGLSAVNLKHAGEFLDSLGGGKVMVYTLPQDSTANPAVAVPMLDLYTKRELVYRYDEGDVLPPDGYLALPMRFTWTYVNPAYYEPAAEVDEDAVAIISGRGSGPAHGWLGEGRLRPLASFDTAMDPFRFNTYVTVYGGDPALSR